MFPYGMKKEGVRFTHTDGGHLVGRRLVAERGGQFIGLRGEVDQHVPHPLRHDVGGEI